MTNNSKYLIHSYSDSDRRNLIEEYIRYAVTLYQQLSGNKI